jgi:hypothetical protein
MVGNYWKPIGDLLNGQWWGRQDHLLFSSSWEASRSALEGSFLAASGPARPSRVLRRERAFARVGIVSRVLAQLCAGALAFVLSRGASQYGVALFSNELCRIARTDFCETPAAVCAKRPWVGGWFTKHRSVHRPTGHSEQAGSDGHLTGPLRDGWPGNIAWINACEVGGEIRLGGSAQRGSAPGFR